MECRSGRTCNQSASWSLSAAVHTGTGDLRRARRHQPRASLRGMPRWTRRLRRTSCAVTTCFRSTTSVSLGWTRALLSAACTTPRDRFRPCASAQVPVRDAPAADELRERRSIRRRRLLRPRGAGVRAGRSVAPGARPQQPRSGPVLGRSHLGVSGRGERDAVSWRVPLRSRLLGHGPTWSVSSPLNLSCAVVI
jgi:hypothetical protein